LGIAEGQNRVEQLLGTFYTDFNTGKFMGSSKESLEKQVCFAGYLKEQCH
jgi:hypothetical protein